MFRCTVSRLLYVIRPELSSGVSVTKTTEYLSISSASSSVTSPPYCLLQLDQSHPTYPSHQITPKGGPDVIVIHYTHLLLVQLLSLAYSSMSAFRLPTLRHAFRNTSLPYFRRIQRRHAQVHDVRFLVTHGQPQRLVEEKYKEKLHQKAKE